MTQPKQIWRLLELGELVAPNDQIWNDRQWVPVVTGNYTVEKSNSPHHRRLLVPAPTWPEAKPISQAPYHQRILVWGDGCRGWAVFHTGAGPVNEQVYQWWLPMPPAPPEPLRDWERAWQWWLENNRRADTDKESFFGGWNNALNWAQKQAALKGGK